MYKAEYEKLTSPSPFGGSYPKLAVSPYLTSKEIICLVLIDGVIIFDQTEEPEYKWYLAGGPVIMVDYEPTRTPEEVSELLRKNSGLIRLVSTHALPTEVWYGNLGSLLKSLRIEVEAGRFLTMKSYDISLLEAVKRLTFGAFGEIVDIHLPDSTSNFWTPHIIRNLGFFTADITNKAFYNYIEIIPHRDLSAWDSRAIFVRVKVDVRRDFATLLSQKDSGTPTGALLQFGATFNGRTHLDNQLKRLSESIRGFEDLLRNRNDDPESVFHEYLVQHPILLDVYGECESKPRFLYPEGETSAVDKTYVEPDFIIVYPGRCYKLVELERPSKEFATKQGHPRQDFNQAGFQVAEWRHYISTHYGLIKDKYPGICSNLTVAIIMSRSHQRNFENEVKLREYLEVMKNGSNVDDIWTYDDLVERCKVAYAKLSAL